MSELLLNENAEPMENAKGVITELIKGYVKAHTEGLITKAADKLSSFMARIIAAVVLFVCMACTVFFGSFTAAFYLSELLGKPYLGFLAICGIYFLFGLLIWWQKEKMIKKPLNDFLLSFVRRDDNSI
jgi:hypothetical protein